MTEELKRLLVYRELLVGKLHRVHYSRRHHRPTTGPLENFAENYSDPDYLVNFAEN
jgi:hypothetical protein